MARADVDAVPAVLPAPAEAFPQMRSTTREYSGKSWYSRLVARVLPSVPGRRGWRSMSPVKAPTM